MIKYERITDNNTDITSLDGYIRTQKVTKAYRLVDGEYRLVDTPFVDDWSAGRKREKAAELLCGEYLSIGAFDDGRLIGFAALNRRLSGRRMILDSMHVSEDYRHQGVGRRLFSMAMEAGRAAGADKLYISANSSMETIAFYRAMGCVPAADIIREMAEDEPYDLQLEVAL